MSALAIRVRERLKELGLGEVEAATRVPGLERNFIRDLVTGKKQSFSAVKAALVAKALDWTEAQLRGDDAVETVQRVPFGQEFEADEEPLENPENADAARRFERRQLLPGELVEREAVAGLGSGGYADRIMVDGKETDSVRALWRVPVDFLHSELRARENDVDILRVDGDSMTPTLLPGDRVLVNRVHTKPSPDGLYVIDDGISIAVKRIDVIKGSRPPRVRIRSDNPLHPSVDEMLAEDLPVLGRVVCKVTRL